MQKTPVTDIIGEALLDYLAGDEEATIQVYSDIAEPDTLPVTYFFREIEQMPDLEREALRHCTGKIADLGAGAGSHALALQQQELDVTAYDISEGACEVMRRRGVRQVITGDALRLGLARYDTILMLMNGLGVVKDPAGLQHFLLHIKNNLNPNGQILVDSSDISYMFYDEEGGLNINLNAEYYGVVTYFMEYKLAVGNPFKWLFADLGMLQDYAEANGFDCRLLYEGEHFQYLAQLTLL